MLCCTVTVEPESAIMPALLLQLPAPAPYLRNLVLLASHGSRQISLTLKLLQFLPH